MADTVKELFNKKFTSSEISSGTTYSITTDANTAYVIKDIEVSQNDTATQKVNATASIGLTSDFSASPSKFMDLGTISSSSVKGASGSEIMDVSSTFSIRVPAQSINFKDIQHSQVSYAGTTNATQVVQKTPSVNGEEETGLAPAVTTSTQFGTNFTGISTSANRHGQFRVFTTNPHQSIDLAISVHGNNNSQSYLNVSQRGGTTNYYTHNGAYHPYTSDGRFYYRQNGTQQIAAYDSKGDNTRSLSIPSGNAHVYLNLKNAAGNDAHLPINGSTYPKVNCIYFTDNQTNNMLICSSYLQGLYWYELPSYDGADGTALAPINGQARATTKYYQLMTYSTDNSSSRGPNSNRWSPYAVASGYTHSNVQHNWYIGTTAASKTKRVLIFHDGNNNKTSSRLYFFMADTEYMSQTSTSDANAQAYSMSRQELETEFGWATSSHWANISSAVAYLNCGDFQNLTGSSAVWGIESQFWLDQDVLYFTNLASANTGEGPIVAWNLKTNTASAPITWAQYVASNGSALSNPGAGDSYISHRSFGTTPTSTEINARTYLKEPTLQVRATAIKEDRS